MRAAGIHFRAIAAVPTVLVLLVLLVLAAPSPAAAKRFVVTGHGNGHGVGMSQWGAYGYAKHGAGYRKIATHYYKYSKVARVRAGKQVRVLIGSSHSVEFSRSRRACGRDLKPGRTYRAVTGGSRVKLERGNGKRIARCGKKLVAKGSGGKIKIGGEGKFRGDLVAAASGGSLLVINQLSLDDYVAGVIANEMPSSWPLAALQAQALAARSYALSTAAGHGPFDVYDDTRSQVYGGLASETKRTNRAVRRSKRQVLEYRGDVITAYFSSSSGGRTENVEYGFPGASPQPYLKSVKDPYDGASPDHRWRLRFSRNGIEAALSGLVKGRFKGIKVTKRGVSPRIVSAKIRGSGGSTRVSGSDLRARLSGRSTWMTFGWRK
jgi:stage II sporulation protein D